MSNEWFSKTYRVQVGCGNLYVIIDYNNDGSFHKVRIPRNTKFHCPLIVRDGLSREATYKGRRDIKQLIKDFKGRKPDACCDKYTVVSKAYSCRDAIAQVFEKEEKTKRTSK